MPTERATKRRIAKESVKLMKKLAKLGPGATIIAILNPALPKEEKHTYIVGGGNAKENSRTLEKILLEKLEAGPLERDYGEEPDDETLDRLNKEAFEKEQKARERENPKLESVSETLLDRYQKFKGEDPPPPPDEKDTEEKKE